MDTSFARLLDWLRQRVVLILAVLALVIVLILVWKQLPSLSPRPATTPTALSGQWTQLNSLFDGKINTLLIADPDGVHTLYAGTEGGVWISADGDDTGSKYALTVNSISYK